MTDEQMYLHLSWAVPGLDTRPLDGPDRSDRDRGTLQGK